MSVFDIHLRKLIGMGSAALAAAVLYSGKATRISRKRLRRTNSSSSGVA